jgi:hypothetical protein
MLHKITSLAALALAAGLVAATPVSIETRDFNGTRPKPNIECDGLILPNFDDCTFDRYKK